MSNRFCIIGFIVMLGLIAGLACSPDDPEPISDISEIIRFITESDDGIELMATDLYSAESFLWDDTLEVYYGIDSIIADPIEVKFYSQTIPIYDNMDFAYGEQIHRYHGNLYRINGIDTTVWDPLYSEIIRQIYFIKLNDDSHPYMGWVYWGYSTNGNLNQGSFVSANGLNFNTNNSAGFDYLQEDEIPMIMPNDSLTYSSDSALFVNAYTSSGELEILKTELDLGKMRTGWRLPASYDRFYNLITICGKTDSIIDTLYPETDSMQLKVSLMRNNDYIYPYKAGVFR